MLTWLAVLAAQTATPAPTPPATISTDVVVSAKRQDRRTRAVIQRLVDPSGFSQMGRFEKKICPGVVGIRSETALALVDLIRANAAAAGAELAPPGCRVSALLFFTESPVEVTNEMFDYLHMARYLPLDRVRALRTGRQPVRSWRLQAPVGRDGQEVGAWAQGMVPINNFARASRIVLSTLSATALSVVVVDSKAAAGKTVQQLADIATMHLLVPLSPTASYRSVDTVLSLFDEREAPPRLTALDRGMLSGCIATNTTTANWSPKPDVWRERFVVSVRPKPSPMPTRLRPYPDPG